MKIKKFRYFAGDFETTVYKGQKETQVWASASVEFNTEDVHIFHSIEEQWEYFKSLNENIVVYYHNLKFDGSFWLDFFLRECKYQQAYSILDDNFCGVEWLKDSEMKNNSFKYSISHMGQWYNMVIKVNNHFIEFRDSLKLLPFSLDRIGKSFKTKHQKLDMEYDGFRYAGCEITEKEKQYIANDVLVLKEALEFMFSQGHNKLTIGSCCLEEFKNTLTFDRYDEKYPDMYKIEIDEILYGSPNAGEYIRKSYKGGWCYLVPEKAEQVEEILDDEPVQQVMSDSNSIENVIHPAVKTTYNSTEENTPVPQQPVRQKPQVNYEEIYNNATPFLQWPEVVEYLQKYSKTKAVLILLSTARDSTF